MKQASVRSKIGIESITDKGELIKSNGSKVIFFKVEPANLAVLSAVNIRTKVISLANLAKVMGMMDMYALDDRENYGANLQFIRQRIDEERSPEIRQILEEEEAFIKEIEADSSSARIFLIAFNIPIQLEDKYKSQLKNFRVLAAQDNIQVSPVDKNELKKILAVYFRHDTTSENFPDYEGEGFYDDVNLPLIESRLRNGETAETIKAEEDNGISFGG